MELPFVFCWAGDPYLIGERYQRLRQELTSRIKDQISEQVFYLSETPLENALESARTLPFLSSFQIFRLFEADRLKAKDIELLAEFLKKKPAATCLIFEIEKIEKESELSELISRFGKAEIFSPESKKNSGGAIIGEKLKIAGKRISSQALERLEEEAGDAPAFMDGILDQLINYAGAAPEITEEMVEAFQENWKEPNVFSFTDALMTQKSAQAVILARRILEGDEKEIIPFLGLLHWQIRRFWQAKTLLNEGVAKEVMFKKCKISPKQAPFFLRQLQAIPIEKLEAALEGLFRLDRDLKTGNAEGFVALESWIYSMGK